MHDAPRPSVWKRVKGHVKEQWGKLTGDYLTEIAGRHDRMGGRLQERFFVARFERSRPNEWTDA